MINLESFINPELPIFEHGIEKETLRFSHNGHLAMSCHPKSFGSPLFHPFITLDFSEAQLELVTEHFPKLPTTFSQLDEILTFVYKNLKNEFLWPYSAPCILPEEEKIPIANFGSSKKGKEKYLYRMGLKMRYGAKMQTLSGLHYNFSFSELFWKNLFSYTQEKGDLKHFITEKYLHIIRNYLREGWLITYLFGATPALHESYFDQIPSHLKKIGEDTLIAEHATTIRMSHFGYFVRAQFQKNISFDSHQSYLRDLKKVLSTTCPQYVKYKGKQLNDFFLQNEWELYGRIRAKPKMMSGKSFYECLKQGISYLEVRSLDLNPFYPNTLDPCAFEFIQIFLLYCLLKKSPKITEEQAKHIYQTQDLVALNGRKKNTTLFDGEKTISLKDWGSLILNEMEPLAKQLGKLDVLERQKTKLLFPEKTPSAMVLKEIFSSENSLVRFCQTNAQKYKDYFLSKKFSKNRLQEFKKFSENSQIEQDLVEQSGAKKTNKWT